MKLSSEAECPSLNGLVAMADDRVPQTDVFLRLYGCLEHRVMEQWSRIVMERSGGELGHCQVAMRKRQLTPFYSWPVLGAPFEAEIFPDDNPVVAL